MRVAIVGCGQLARMLALSGIPLGIEFTFLADDGPDTDVRCVRGLGDIVYWYEDLVDRKLFEALGEPDVVSFEKEMLNAALVETLSDYCQIAPSCKAIRICQNRLKEKTFLDSINVPSADYCFVNSASQFRRVTKDFNRPVVVKSISQGYDGKNQWRINSSSDVDEFIDLTSASMFSDGFIVEERVSFICEVSLIGVRSQLGKTFFYAPTENIHQNGILIRSQAPAANIDTKQVKTALDYLQCIMDTLDYTGVMAMECFVTPNQLLVNELAPRVHNSGHWTQQGAMTCQFENHIRAITGLAPGETRSHGYAGMINVLGSTEPPRTYLSEASTLHWYGKINRKGRKLGHVNFLASSQNHLDAEMLQFHSRGA